MDVLKLVVAIQLFANVHWKTYRLGGAFMFALLLHHFLTNYLHDVILILTVWNLRVLFPRLAKSSLNIWDLKSD
jgi:hypothetical protein